MTEKELKNQLPEFILNSKIYSLVITDLEGKYTYVNEVFKKRFAFMNTDFVGKPFWIAIHPEDVEKCNIAAYQCITNPNETFEVQVRKPYLGDFYWTEWEFSLFKDENKNPIGILCLGSDITETKRADKQAKYLAGKVETIIEEITDGFYILNREWEFVKINTVAEQLLGMPRKKLLGNKIWDLFPHTPDYNYPTQFRKAMNEYVTLTVEDYWADIDRWLSAVCYPSQEGLTVFFKDITQEKKTQEQLKQSETMLRALYDSSSEASTFIDKNFNILFTNRLAKETCKSIFGKEPQIGDKSLDYIVPDLQTEFANYYQRVLQGETIYVEKEHCGLYWSFSLFPVYDTENNIVGISSNTKDITARKTDELKILNQNETLRQIAWQQSHELRRPMANILGLINVLQTDKTLTQEEKEQYLTYIFQATQQLDKIIHKIVTQSNESEYNTNE